MDNAPWHSGDVATVTAEQAAKFVERQKVAVLVDEYAG